MDADNINILVKRLNSNDDNDFQKLIKLFNKVFEEKENIVPDIIYLKQLLDNPLLIVLVAIVDDETVAGLTAFELPLYYTEASEMFIYDLAVKPQFQKRGIGRQLIQVLKTLCLEKGIKEIFVAANKEDTHALNFYRSCCAEEEEVIHFNYLLK